MAFGQLPAYQGGNALNFQPVQNALSDVAQTNQNYARMAQQQQSIDLEKQRTASELQTAGLQRKGLEQQQAKQQAEYHGGIAQAILNAPPDKQPALAQQYMAAHPELADAITKNGFRPEDVAGWATSLRDEALGPQNPLDVQSKQLGIKQAEQNYETGKNIPISMGVDPTTYQEKKGLFNPTNKTTTSFNPDGTVTTRPVTEAPAGGAPASGSNTLPSATGPDGQQLPVGDYLKQIPDAGMRGKIGAVLRGEDTLAAISSRNPIYGQTVQRLVYGYDPLFSPVEAKARYDINKSLASHKAGDLGAYSDSIGKMTDHLGELTNAAKDLKTTPVIQWNRATQTFNTQGGDPAQVKFGTYANVYLHELAKVLKGGTNAAPTDADMEGLAQNFSSNLSQPQLKAVINAWDHASRAAIESTDATTQKAFGNVFDAAKHSVVTPYAQKKFDALDNNRWLKPQTAKYQAVNDQGHKIESDDGKTWREAK